MPMIGRISSRSRTGSTGVDSSRIASCYSRMMRRGHSSRSSAAVDNG